jgi:hypothetical protein
VEVIRLLGYPAQQSEDFLSHLLSRERDSGGSGEAMVPELWISLTGRNVEDHDPIVTITRHPSLSR